MDEQGDKARTYNQLGIAHFLKDDLRQAALYFRQAAQLRPGDSGIEANLERAMEALGRTTPVERGFVGKAASAGPKAAAMEIDVESFYWIEW